MARTFVIVNPTAGGGTVAKLWPSLCERLLKTLGAFEFASTYGPGHARQLASEAKRDGYGLIVACGGDGTIHEVANGILATPTKKKPILGLLSLGTGCDFIKSLGIPRSIASQVSILKGKKTRWIDVGQIHYRHQDKTESRFFVNVADAGMGADVMNRGRSWKIFSRRLAYFLATLESFAHWKNKPIKIVFDNQETWEGDCLLVAVANGQFFGTGMPIAPRASLSDGYFDITIISKLTPLEMSVTLPLLYAKHLDRLPHVLQRRTRKITLTSSEEVFLDIDGEQVGSLPAQFEIKPRHLEVKVL